MRKLITSSLRATNGSEAIQSRRGNSGLDCFVATLLAMTVLTACATTENSYKDYLAKRHVADPAGLTLQHCHAYGCQVVSDITLTQDEWNKITSIFKPVLTNAQQERERISKAIGLFERIVGPKDGTQNDIRGTFRQTGRDQLDCVDESTNTTTWLAMLQQAGLLRFHVLQPPTMRFPIIHAGRWPHQTAVLREKQTGIDYAIDSWFQDNGHDADIIDLKTWKSGWKPESVHDFL